MSWGRALSRHSGSGSSVRPSALPLRVTTLLLSFSRCLWMSSDTTRGQSSWFRPLESTHTSTYAAHTSCFKGTHITNTHNTSFLCPASNSLNGKTQIFTHIAALVYELDFYSHINTSPPRRWQQVGAPWGNQALLQAAAGVWILVGRFSLRLSLADTAAWSSMVGTSSQRQKQ